MYIVNGSTCRHVIAVSARSCKSVTEAGKRKESEFHNGTHCQENSLLLVLQIIRLKY
jgi:hypothetical protein